MLCDHLILLIRIVTFTDFVNLCVNINTSQDNCPCIIILCRVFYGHVITYEKTTLSSLFSCNQNYKPKAPRLNTWARKGSEQTVHPFMLNNTDPTLCLSSNHPTHRRCGCYGRIKARQLVHGESKLAQGFSHDGEATVGLGCIQQIPAMTTKSEERYRVLQHPRQLEDWGPLL